MDKLKMKSGPNKILGLAVGEKSILVAEVSQADGRRQIGRADEFVYPTGISLQEPQALGEAFGEFLKTAGFTAKAAIIGIPAKWVLTKPRELPPVDPSLAADMLRLQVETEFSAELKDLVYDYAGKTDVTQSTHVLLAATPRRHVEQAQAIAEAARLDLRAIAPTAIVLSALTAGEATDTLVLSITPSGTELAAHRGSHPSLLRHVGSSVAVTATVAGEVRRASHMLPRNGASIGNGTTNGHAHGQVVVWDDAGLDAAARRAVTEALGPSARAGDFISLGAGSLPGGAAAHAAAVALAVAGMTAGALPIDFLHPRLAEPQKARVPRQTVLAIAAAFAVLVGIIWAYADLNSKQKYRDELVQDNLLKVEDVKNSRTAIATYKIAEGWHNTRPRYVACLADLTNAAVPKSTRTEVFLFSLTLDDSMHGEIQGRATSQKAANDFLRTLNGNTKRFASVNTGREKENRNAGTKAEFPYSFTINFVYLPG